MMQERCPACQMEFDSAAFVVCPGCGRDLIGRCAAALGPGASRADGLAMLGRMVKGLKAMGGV